MAAEQITPGLVEPQGLGEEPLYYATRVFLLFLQGLFKQFPEGSYRWSEDAKLSEIAITSQTPIPREQVGDKPTIVAARGPAQFANLSLDQMKSIDVHTGAKTRMDIISCTMSLNCLSKNSVEAQRIAWIVMRHVRAFKELIQRIGKLHKLGDEIQIGPESPPGALVTPEGDIEAALVTVQCPFFFTWQETVTPLANPLLRSIEAHIEARLPNPATLSTDAAVRMRSIIGAPTIRGRVIGVVGEFPSAPIKQTVKT